MDFAVFVAADTYSRGRSGDLGSSEPHALKDLACIAPCQGCTLKGRRPCCEGEPLGAGHRKRELGSQIAHSEQPIESERIAQEETRLAHCLECQLRGIPYELGLASSLESQELYSGLGVRALEGLRRLGLILWLLNEASHAG